MEQKYCKYCKWVLITEDLIKIGAGKCCHPSNCKGIIIIPSACSCGRFEKK